jgi:ERF superfamily
MNDQVRSLVPTVSHQQATAFTDLIVRAATDATFDTEKMLIVLQMNERIQDRNAKAAFDSDFTMMQDELPMITRDGQIKIPAKDGKSARVQGRYAKFETINDVVKPILSKYSFAISFRTKVLDTKITIIGCLRHAGGHSEESDITLPPDVSGGKNSVQAIGSTISYGKRYMMTALLNITTEGEDDDGASAGPAGGQMLAADGTVFDSETGEVKRQRPQSTGQPGLLTSGQLAVLQASLDRKSVSAQTLCEKFNVAAMTQLPVSKLNEALAYVESL